MRDIKYRLWDKFEKKWKELYSYHLAPNGQLYYGGMNITEHNEIVFWTGLTDKNGKEIYEGDILDSNDSGHLVIQGMVDFRKGRYVLGQTEGREDDLFVAVEGGYTVIGNIHSDPHLLEGSA